MKITKNPTFLFFILFLSFSDRGLAFDDSYGLNDPYQTAMDEQGHGLSVLYGTTNFRFLLKNLIYRGGANNIYLSPQPRPEKNPLPNIGLKNLCKEDFTTSLYLEGEGFETAPKTTQCWRPQGGRNRLEYSRAVLDSIPGIKSLFEIIYNRIEKRSDEKIYLHCWTGEGKSAFAGALILRQFCGWSTQQAVNYYERTSHSLNGLLRESLSVPTSAEKMAKEDHKKFLQSFTPYAEFKIDPSHQDEFCPLP